jgi:hypothetical protein
VFDPFAGCGTTNVTAKQAGVNSVGLEAHPFVHWVATVKTYWEFDLSELRATAHRLLASWRQDWEVGAADCVDLEPFPELVHKCYSEGNLRVLQFLRNEIEARLMEPHVRDLLRLALVDTLRTASKAGTGWPYIAPSRYHEKAEQEAFTTFSAQVQRMVEDLQTVRAQTNGPAECHLIHGDSRQRQERIAHESIDLVVTSPPYLNNYDYADRTRLEMYFLGWANSWRDITERVRDKLIIAATTQIRRSAFEGQPRVHQELTEKIAELERRRHAKGGKKNYDLMVAGYFNDMFQVLQRVAEALKPGAPSVWVLGDSAPYGVYIPTEEYLGELARGLGFSRYEVEILRRRGEKWAHNPQRHKVPLKESLLTIIR